MLQHPGLISANIIHMDVPHRTVSLQGGSGDQAAGAATNTRGHDEMARQKTYKQ
jgi:hypothetical protein